MFSIATRLRATARTAGQLRLIALLLAALLAAFNLAACDSQTDADTGEPDEELSQEGQRIPMEQVLDSAIVTTVNPSGIAPLTAELRFRTKGPVNVSIRVLGAEPLTHRFREPATNHAVPVVGLYPGRQNQVVLRLETDTLSYAVDTLSIATAPLPEFMPAITINQARPRQMEPGWNLSSFNIGLGNDFGSYPIMFDRNGDIRWYLDFSRMGTMVFLVERSHTGNLLLGAGHSIFEYDMLGHRVHEFKHPGYWFHHEVIEKPDGNLIVAVDKDGLATVEDHIIEIDRSSGAIVNTWDLRQSLDYHRRSFSADSVDWFHMNGIAYSPSDDALIVSGRVQGVVKLTRDNKVVWILAPHRGWGRAGMQREGDDTAKYLLTAVDASGSPYPAALQDGAGEIPAFRWPWGQHAPILLPNGNLFLFDNGAFRKFSNDGQQISRGVEYRIDESKKTVQQVWQYGEERGAAFFSGIISDVDYLPQRGNRLIMPGIVFTGGASAFVTEVTYPEGAVVFDARLQFRNLYSNGTLSWGNFDMVYRSERLMPYPLTATSTQAPAPPPPPAAYAGPAPGTRGHRVL